MFLKHFLVFFVIALALTAVVVVGWYQSAVHYRAPQDKTLTVPAGDSVSVIANHLQQAGLIKSELAFKIYLKLSGQTGLQAGDYDFKTGDDLKVLAKRLTLGQVNDRERVILIKEGMSVKEILKYLADNRLLNENCQPLFTAYVSELPDSLRVYDFWQDAPTRVDSEGFIFPDTYRVFKDATCRDLLNKAFANFNYKVDESLRAEIKRQHKTLLQVLTMASLLEKEVRSEKDMKIVSGIFWRRLTSGQRLESCATLAYILGENKPQYTAEDTQIDSPYNTYRHDGLPPTPIGNPGLTAIRAAVYPTETDYNYFLSRPDTGATVFAQTYEEHLANKRHYLQTTNNK